jgi:hypothetical protein
MPNRFSTQAANADAMRENARASEGMTDEIGADGTPRDRSDHSSQAEKKGSDTKAGDAKAAESKDDQAKPGKDVSSAGFIKDKDAAKP